MIPTLPFLALTTLCGLALGSYAVTAGIRLARSEPSSRGRSHCDACGAPLSFAQTLPVASYVWLRGACRACGGRIDPTHLVGEVAGGMILLQALSIAPLARGLMLAALGLLLLVASVVDLRVRRLPDALVLPIAGLCLALAVTGSEAVTGLIAAFLTLALLALVRWTSRKRRGDPGLGLGDVKLLTALALWLGARTPWAVVVAAGLGLVAMAAVRPRDGRLAFGPMIALGAWIVGMSGEAGWWPTTM